MIELIIAFGAGLISFLSPCVLPLIPGYISYISGSSINELVDKKNINLFPRQPGCECLSFFGFNRTDSEWICAVLFFEILKLSLWEFISRKSSALIFEN